MAASSVVELFRIALLVSLLLESAHPYNFLLSHPFYGASHVLTLRAVTENLLGRGHSVTTVRFFDPTSPWMASMGENHTDVVLHLNNSDGRLPLVTREEKGAFKLPLDLLWSKGNQQMRVFWNLGLKPWAVVDAYCDTILGDGALLERLQAVKFDVFIADMIYNECGLALAHHLDAELPTVGFWAFSFISGEPDLTTASMPASYVPNFMSELPAEMSFCERAFNLAWKLLGLSLMFFHCLRCDQNIARHMTGTPRSWDLLADLNGALINSNMVVDYPRLLPETFVNVGGMQIRDDPKPLPKDLQDFLDDAKHGVILFTMGFVFETSFVPKERIDALFSVFERLQPQRVVMRLDMVPENTPANVLIKPFLPQQDIMAHPNVILFLTHCGMHGVLEAVWNKVPMVGMPVFIDQFDVGAKIAERGAAKVLSKWAKADDIYNAIVEVRDNPKYKKAVTELSALLKLRREHPMETAVGLLEFLAATGGAKHLQLSSRKLSYVQYFCLDIVLFALALMGACVYSVKWLFRRPKKQKKD